MKKVFAICLAVVMVFALGINVMAAPNNFVESPSNDRAPIIIEGTDNNGDCTTIVVVTPYGDRENLTPEQKENFENAYNQIVNADNLEEMFSGITSIVSPGTVITDLAVSDLFNMSYSDPNYKGGPGSFKIELPSETLSGFVGLIQFIDGKWSVIEGAVVNGNNLSFTVDQLGTIAVVVDRTKAESTSPITGAPLTNYVIYSAVFAVVAFAAAVVVFTKKKAN